MAVQSIRLFGDPVLTTPAVPVTAVDDSLRRLVQDMHDTMDHAGGVGLAAPQIGVGLRVLVYRIDGERGHLVNPVLEFPDDEVQVGPEGCLSIPDLRFDVTRRLRTVARGLDQQGEPVVIEAEGYLARCLQHEVDHLDGVLYLDRLSREDRREALRQIREADWNEGAGPALVLGARGAFGLGLDAQA